MLSARNLEFFGNQDFVWGIALMISGVFIAIAVLYKGISDLRIKEIIDNKDDWDLGQWWDKTVTFIVPTLGATLFLWWLSLSATVYAPQDWYNPFSPYSVMTCIVQWGIVLAALFLLNKWIVSSILSQEKN